MNRKITVAIDAMGGDFAPVSAIEGSVDALAANENLSIILVGDKETLEKGLEGQSYDKDRLEIVHASEVIKAEEHPMIAVQRKKDASLLVAMKLVKDGRADAVISAGSTGAMLLGSRKYVGLVKGVERPALAPLIPSVNGFSLLIDCGANVDARPASLVKFAKMGSIYMEHLMGVKNPRVGLLNIGTEEYKGNQLVRETFPLLKECKDINFIGSLEARDVPFDKADVIVAEAFAGNVVLKMYEGVAAALMSKIKETMMASLKGKIGGLLIKKDLKNTLKVFDASEHGGAPMFGTKGLVVKAHGNSTRKEIRIAVEQCMTFVEQDIAHLIEIAVQPDNQKEMTENDI